MFIVRCLLKVVATKSDTYNLTLDTTMNNNIDIQSIKLRFGIIGNSPLLNNAIERAALVAPTDMNVLITGESGTGKESFSKIIHQLSTRKHGSFIAVNCGAIPEGTIDSELFGHEKGAFTGATETRKGFFEVTDGGTIFLDEIGEMPLGTQARLLRVLENGEFIKVGSSKVQKTDVRVVAATNADLMQSIEQNKFREDLYYRLSTVPIYVPPLRDRGKDLFLIFRKFAADFSEKYRTAPIELTEDARVTLSNYRFPGNVRQLKNLVDQISITSEQREITAETLASYLPPEQKSSLPALFTQEAGTDQPSSVSERELLYKVLFDMRADMNELKKLVFQLMNASSDIDQDTMNEHKELFSEYTSQSVGASTSLPSIFVDKGGIAQNESIIELEDDHAVEDISHETEEESLSLEKKEKEMIIKALKQNNNKRKYAAKDLGISERTLYRKIKKYELESM